MITIAALREYGADVDDGLARCMNSEDFYLKMVKMVVADDKIYKLESALDRHDLDEAFEQAHALKGMLANLSLTPVLNPVVEITEHLRSRTDMDYGPLISEAKKEFEALVQL